MTTTPSVGDRERENILVAGHPYIGYVRMLADGFSEIGLDSTCLEWQMPKRNPLDHVRTHLSAEYDKSVNEEITSSCSKALERKILELNPDYVLVIDGNEVTRKTSDYCSSNGIVLALWAYDSICNFPWIAEAAPSYDLAFTHEPRDVEALSVNSPAEYLPMAYSPELYFPINPAPKRDIDVFFAGSIRSNYPERTALLRRIGRAFPHLSIRVFSHSIPPYSPFRIHDLLITIAGNDSRIVRGGAGHQEINRMYNCSRICINIHNSQSLEAVSPRTFEILGSAGLLLTDRLLPHSGDLKAGSDYIYYSSGSEMLAAIENVIENDEEARKIAVSGHSKAKRNHTFTKRAETIYRSLWKAGDERGGRRHG